MKTYDALKKKAEERYGLNLTKSKSEYGKYQLSGMISGENKTITFNKLKDVEAELNKPWQFKKAADVRTLTYSGKQYEIRIEPSKSAPYGVLYINGVMMGSVFTSIQHAALVQYIQEYKREYEWIMK